MKNNHIITGILICFIIGIIAFYLGKSFPLIGGAVFGITIGIALNAIFSKQAESISIGTNFTGKKFLHYAIILLGFEMSISDVISVGLSSLWIMLFTLLATFITAYIVAKILKIDFITGTLIGVGTSICGGSAIAATAPVVNASNQQISYAIATIFLFNIIAVFLFPALGHLLHMHNEAFGIWAGTAINDTSSVLAAAYSYSDESGALATIVKLTRTLIIIPITFGLSIYMAKAQTANTDYKFELTKAIPYFITGFVITTIINSLGFIPSSITHFLAQSGKFLIIVAMVGIGLNTDLAKLLRNGIKPIIMGLVCWTVLSIVALIMLYFMGYI
ncbi:YeiH family protein [Wohlfahrtiimonas larvae]|uniref:YeiH family protein n=1 Tax=Wohlfahrtiimonas larvae TaxID=1157986 RepID=A0ABP9MIY2_9GAMM|nr:YeiH family protein [Wohlfahrtiimonas larvae]